jgi:hypothetical protein
LAGVWENDDTARACEEARIAAKETFGLGVNDLHLILVAIAKGFRKASAIFKVPTRRSDRIHQILAKVLEHLTTLDLDDSEKRESGRGISPEGLETARPI